MESREMHKRRLPKEWKFGIIYLSMQLHRDWLQKVIEGQADSQF